MKIKTTIGITILAAFSLFAIGSFAQKSSAQTNSSNPAPSPTMNGSMGQGGMMYGHMANGGTMYGRMMNGSMMNGRMMHGNNMYGRGMMGRTMMGNYNSMRKLMDRLASDLSAARADANSAAIKSKLADAGSLVSKLRGDLSNSWGMMMKYMPMNGNTTCNWNQSGQQPQQKP